MVPTARAGKVAGPDRGPDLYRGPMRHSDRVAATLVARLPAESTVASVRRGDTTVVGAEAAELLVANGPGAAARLDGLGPGFWVGWCSFELGHTLERVPPRAASLEPATVPDVGFARFDAVAVVGADGAVRVHGDGDGRARLEHAARGLDDHDDVVAAPRPSGRWHSSLDRDAYQARVDVVLDLLRAGECYQVNLTRRLGCDHALDPVALYGALASHHRAPHTAMLRIPDLGGGIAVVSASPERYLLRRGDHVETRPIKGTAATRAALTASAKDHAENVMIVDLARNDLGRVCVPGSIHVPSLCSVEAHPGLHHLVSTVRGRVRREIGMGALVGATFPPASVTGAPKPRVLRVIEELEPVRRGVYCGAIGWIDTRADDPARVEADLAVAIRTFTIHGAGAHGCTQFGVGGGIVADSRPDAEWGETELKAARLLELAGADAGALVRSSSARWVWLDGALVAAADARISPFDHGLLVGDGVFETVRVYGGRPFAWTRHLDRLEHSAEGLGLPVPGRDELRAAADAVLGANGHVEARLRITVTGGVAPLGSERGDAGPTVIVATSEVTSWPDSVRVVVVPWVRNDRGATAGLKTTSYAENVRALAYAHERDAGEAIFANTRDELCEATGSNVFVVRDGVISTPPASSGCLLGVTRALLFELGTPIEETALPSSALRDADEAFLTSTTREVQPISAVDGRELPGAPGPVTAHLAAAFTALVTRDLDP